MRAVCIFVGGILDYSLRYFWCVFSFVLLLYDLRYYNPVTRTYRSWVPAQLRKDLDLGVPDVELVNAEEVIISGVVLWLICAALIALISILVCTIGWIKILYLFGSGFLVWWLGYCLKAYRNK